MIALLDDSEGHANLRGSANAAPIVTVDVLLIEGNELSELARHLKHPLYLAYVQERQQLRECLAQRIPHYQPIDVGEIDVSPLVLIDSGKVNGEKAFLQGALPMAKEEENQVQKIRYLQYIVDHLHQPCKEVLEPVTEFRG